MLRLVLEAQILGTPCQGQCLGEEVGWRGVKSNLQGFRLIYEGSRNAVTGKMLNVSRIRDARRRIPVFMKHLLLTD